ncbi:MAG: hypothetical protein Q8S27_06645 [Hoeflea sp.]|uniref:hypothetical protein n=1 Tax=Hoeflea sp. TaxID=1940281 RepID=UPI002731344F|nr:hypothetical protein [Hoeflea sp.]MDP2122127.1 hypothetical protein [Hoeflea sp.]MDP3524241.1 hypothetical protein [Hoeflea sp.]
MSMFSFPADMTTNEMMKSMTAMTDWTKTADLKVSPLMVYPLGAAMAATAVGIGMAGQMTGLMMGTMQAAMTSQRSLLGAHPDLSWIVPVLAEDLAPKEDESEAEVAAAKPATRTGSADIVAFAPEPAAIPAKTKAKAAKPAKAAPAMKVADKPVEATAPVKDGAVAVVEKLKSDAKVAAAVADEPAPAPRAAKAAPAASMEPEDFRRPVEIERPEVPDDLKLISGIGPKLEQVLNGLGVFSFAQIAAWQPEEVAWVDDYLQFSGRIDRDDWIAQAGQLAKGGATA